MAVDDSSDQQNKSSSDPAPKDEFRRPADPKAAQEQALPAKKARVEKQNTTLKYEDAYLRAIPRSNQYEKSFMHRNIISHVKATGNDFIITASEDGHLKFWKKKHNEGIEFVKHFRCHLKGFSDIAINHTGALMATCCTQDKTVKVFDVANFDMINMFKLDFSPRCVCFVHQGSDLISALAISDANSGKIYVLDANGDNKHPIHIFESLHQHPVILIQYTAAYDVAISFDEIGMAEYWSGSKNGFEFPRTVNFEFKTDTDLYEFCKIKKLPKALTISPDGRTFAVWCSNAYIYIFNLANGRIIKKLDETLHRYIEMGKETKGNGLPAIEWNRRVALEKEMNRDSNALRFISMAYDSSGNFLIFPTPLGITVFNLVTDKVVRRIGLGENLRFIGVTLCRAVPSVTEKLQGAATSVRVEAADNPNLRISEPDPMLVACAHRSNRFYLFTNVEPYAEEADGSTHTRDVYNEKPLNEDMITAVEEEAPQSKLCNRAIVYTTFGDIHIELYPDKTPKTVENFCTHARRGYYNGHTFHRVIKSFMIQTGDPTGRGTGGQSIWGGDFEDEFHPTLRHDKAFKVSMANAGPNTNGSQFFVTVCPAEWLDGKNTIFGQVVEGYNVVQKINQVPVYEKSGRPREEISIISISLKSV
uniref:peptidylprolyl isomerase n=1 Tax=Globodera rostochiensis TaxID=31243 RepID=A0A914I6V2_GLORO